MLKKALWLLTMAGMGCCASYYALYAGWYYWYVFVPCRPPVG